MGTSIVSRLLVEEGMMILAGIFAAIACVIFVVLTAGFLRYRHPSFERTTMAEWSMFFIGILALGAALSGLTDIPTFRLIGFWIGGPITVTRGLSSSHALMASRSSPGACHWLAP